MATIEIHSAQKRYPGNVLALKGIDLTIQDGELLVLVGPSGCGKSTLLRMIAGLETISDGTIALDGKVVNDVEPADRDIAMVFQNYALYPHMSVYGNLEYGLKNRGTPRAERETRIAEAARVLELEPYLHRKPAALSGGQRQRVAMGRAIVRKPRAFLFDEPLSNLDAKLRGHMRVEIRRLQKALGATSVYVTHDQLEAMTLADRLVVMNAGRIEQVGTPYELYARPQTTFVARFIGSPGMNLVATDDLRGSSALLSPALPVRGGMIGFRPEDLSLQPIENPAISLTGRIEGVEVLGAESLLYVNGGPQIGTLIARVPGAYLSRAPLAEITLSAPMEAVHLYDATERRIN